MKLTIFLDIDGVLNHEHDAKDCKVGPKVMGERGWVILCKECIDRLNQLIACAITEAHYDEVDVVVSSTWRKYLDSRALGIVLSSYGYNFTIDGATAVNDSKRGQQIVDYMKKHSTDAYVVLDDYTHDMALVTSRQTVTSYKSGFDENCLNQAISLILE